MSKKKNRHKGGYGDAPIQDKHRFKMNRVARMLDDIFNEGLKAPHKPVAWILLVTDYGEDAQARLNFISNGIERASVVELFKEMIGRFEADPATPESSSAIAKQQAQGRDET